MQKVLIHLFIDLGRAMVLRSVGSQLRAHGVRGRDGRMAQGVGIATFQAQKSRPVRRL
ncbi:hypothetical protein ACH19I_02200 [Yersinia kristensenii]|uniref:hypothetical protein n=1 Tax=Yersinia kristensenii TaxID=28152 RepID=UPI003896E87D